MATLLAVTWASGRRERCDARCHDARGPSCRCCCGGYYHGRRSGSRGLEQAVAAMQTHILDGLRAHEALGELRVTFARAELLSPPLIRAGRPRPYQLALPL